MHNYNMSAASVRSKQSGLNMDLREQNFIQTDRSQKQNILELTSEYQTGNFQVGFNNTLNSVVQQSTGNKEAGLRKLLETQDNYIYELEAKCKAMSTQLNDSPFKSHDG